MTLMKESCIGIWCKMIKKPGFSQYNSRNFVVRSMGYKDYRDYLSSDLWRDIKNKVLTGCPKCIVCHKSSEVVHHLAYGKKVLLNGGTGVVALCNLCHQEVEVDVNGEKETWSMSVTKLLCLLTYRKRFDIAKQVARRCGRRFSKKWYNCTYQEAAELLRVRSGVNKYRDGKTNR